MWISVFGHTADPILLYVVAHTEFFFFFPFLCYILPKKFKSLNKLKGKQVCFKFLYLVFSRVVSLHLWHSQAVCAFVGRQAQYVPCGFGGLSFSQAPYCGGTDWVPWTRQINANYKDIASLEADSWDVWSEASSAVVPAQEPSATTLDGPSPFLDTDDPIAAKENPKLPQGWWQSVASLLYSSSWIPLENLSGNWWKESPVVHLFAAGFLLLYSYSDLG